MLYGSIQIEHMKGIIAHKKKRKKLYFNDHSADRSNLTTAQ